MRFKCLSTFSLLRSTSSQFPPSLLVKLSSSHQVVNLRSFSFLRKFADPKSLNPEWKSVGLNVKPYRWPNIIRKELVTALQQVAVPHSEGQLPPLVDAINRGEAKQGLITDGRLQQNLESKITTASIEKRKTVRNNINDNPSSCSIVLGTQGSGRSTAVKQALKELKHVEQIPFNFEEINNRSFIPFIIQFYTSIIDNVEEIVRRTTTSSTFNFNNSDSVSQFVFKSVSAVHPEFSNVLLNYIRDVTTRSYPSAYSSSPKLLNFLLTHKAFSQENGEKTSSPPAMLFTRLCSILHNNSGSYALRKAKTPLSSCLTALWSIAEYEENSTAYIRTEGSLQCYPTGERSLKYLLTVIADIGALVGAPVCLVFKNVEVVARSPFLQERGFAFLTNLVDTLNRRGRGSPSIDTANCADSRQQTKHAIPAYLITDDSMLVLRLLYSKHVTALDLLLGTSKGSQLKGAQNVNSVGSSTTPNDLLSTSFQSLADQPPTQSEQPIGRVHNNIQIIPVNDWSKELIRQVFLSLVTDSNLVVDGVTNCVGGNASFLQRIAKGLNNTDLAMQEDLYSKGLFLVKELRTKREEIVDLPHKAIAQEKVDFERFQRQQYYVRDCLTSEFPREILSFQWKMSQLLSLPIMENLRIKCKTHVAYYVAVLETIRILLSQDYWIVREEEVVQISNPVVLGLLDVKAYRVQFEPSVCLCPYDKLTKSLLHSFINEKFENLSWVNRIKYNTTFGMNCKDLRKRLWRMPEVWS